MCALPSWVGYGHGSRDVKLCQQEDPQEYQRDDLRCDRVYGRYRLYSVLISVWSVNASVLLATLGIRNDRIDRCSDGLVFVFYDLVG